ncbi:MAG: hypothetical protein P8N17_03280 [Luminiphilus sp.]|nr:hypothetical protein [Luminiphilus sp.]
MYSWARPAWAYLRNLGFSVYIELMGAHAAVSNLFNLGGIWSEHSIIVISGLVRLKNEVGWLLEI